MKTAFEDIGYPVVAYVSLSARLCLPNNAVASRNELTSSYCGTGLVTAAQAFDTGELMMLVSQMREIKAVLPRFDFGLDQGAFHP